MRREFFMLRKVRFWNGVRPGKTSDILHSANYADKRGGATPPCTHNQGHYVSWRGFARYDAPRSSAASYVWRILWP